MMQKFLDLAAVTVAVVAMLALMSGLFKAEPTVAAPTAIPTTPPSR